MTDLLTQADCDVTLPVDCIHISSHFDNACGCTEEFYETNHGYLRLHVSKTGSVIDCSIGDSCEEDEQFCAINSELPCRGSAYTAIIKSIPEENRWTHA